MPIEIKELHIKVKIQEEGPSTINSALNLTSENVKVLKESIVKECFAKVLEKIKEKNER